MERWAFVKNRYILGNFVVIKQFSPHIYVSYDIIKKKNLDLIM